MRGIELHAVFQAPNVNSTDRSRQSDAGCWSFQDALSTPTLASKEAPLVRIQRPIRGRFGQTKFGGMNMPSAFRLSPPSDRGEFGRAWHTGSGRRASGVGSRGQSEARVTIGGKVMEPRRAGLKSCLLPPLPSTKPSSGQRSTRYAATRRAEQSTESIVAISHKRDPADLPAVQPQAALHRPMHRLHGYEWEEKRVALAQAAQDHRQVAGRQKPGSIGNHQSLIRR